MKLEARPDLDEVSRRWSAFWRGERLDRPLVSIVVPRPGVEPVRRPRKVVPAEGSIADIDAVAEQHIRWAETHEFLGEALPYCYFEFGPDHFSALLGAELEFSPESPNTSWCVPFINEWDAAEIKFRRDGKWWERTVEFISSFRARCDGRVLLAGPTLVAGLDCLAAIRGAENLLLDLALAPEKVHAALAAVNRAYDEILAAFKDELGVADWGSMNRHGMYSPGMTGVPQCDISCMISPEMFREFAAPAIRHEAAALDGAEYHLDGPGALVHVPAICEIEEIHAIQWVPGAGQPPETEWLDLYRDIDSRGMGLSIGLDAPTTLRMAGELSSPRQFYRVRGLRTREEGEEFLEEIGRAGRAGRP